jgi:hypothetical protein
LYDDGFLGILSNPTVCKFLKPFFTSLYCWEISGWSLSSHTLNSLSSQPAIDVNKLPVNLLGVRWRKDYSPTDSENFYIIESKYMDYSLLPCLVLNKANNISTYTIPFYFEHPWDLKRNMKWPDKLEKKVIRSYPVEKYLVQHLDCNSHVLTGMTSTIVFVSELVKLSILPKHRVSLLLSTDFESSNFVNPSEAVEFSAFMSANYGEWLYLQIYMNGVIIYDSYGL